MGATPPLWFAWKFVPLWYQQQQGKALTGFELVVICLKIRTFVVSATTAMSLSLCTFGLWFAWKFVPLWYQQQQLKKNHPYSCSCDLLENSYLCGISNNRLLAVCNPKSVVICLKIRTFVVSATTTASKSFPMIGLWFAWKFVPLWYQQQHEFVTLNLWQCCDLLENSYLCGISNNNDIPRGLRELVVICLKIRTFVVSATTGALRPLYPLLLWFAWKFVPLWYQQQQYRRVEYPWQSCDLLENSYLCGISNNGN